MYERKDGDFILFKNDNRKTEKHPSHTGELLLGGVTYRVSAWPKVDRNGKTFLAGNAQVKTMNRNPKAERDDFDADPPPDQDLPKRDDDFDQDIPF